MKNKRLDVSPIIKLVSTLLSICYTAKFDLVNVFRKFDNGDAMKKHEKIFLPLIIKH